MLATRVGRVPRLGHNWADGAYRGGVADWAKGHRGWTVEIVKDAPRRFRMLPAQEPTEGPVGSRVIVWRRIVEPGFA